VGSIPGLVNKRLCN